MFQDLNIDQCEVPIYSHKDLNTMYYQNPVNIIPILQLIINSPDTNKKKC